MMFGRCRRSRTSTELARRSATTRRRSSARLRRPVRVRVRPRPDPRRTRAPPAGRRQLRSGARPRGVAARLLVAHPRTEITLRMHVDEAASRRRRACAARSLSLETDPTASTDAGTSLPSRQTVANLKRKEPHAEAGRGRCAGPPERATPEQRRCRAGPGRRVAHRPRDNGRRDGLPRERPSRVGPARCGRLRDAS